MRDYIGKHGISYNWLFCGDLKGLLRMPLKKERPSILTVSDIVELYAEMSLEERLELSRKVVEISANQS